MDLHPFGHKTFFPSSLNCIWQQDCYKDRNSHLYLRPEKWKQISVTKELCDVEVQDMLTSTLMEGSLFMINLNMLHFIFTIVLSLLLKIGVYTKKTKQHSANQIQEELGNCLLSPGSSCILPSSFYLKNLLCNSLYAGRRFFCLIKSNHLTRPTF